MDRSDWLKEQRRETKEQYDMIWSPLYDEKWGLYPNATHQKFIRQFLGFLPPHSTILDAACGAGRYLPMVLEAGHTVIGIDQSQGMLTSLKMKFPDVQVENVGLQEMSYQDAFDGAICMDAMEYIPHEDWPPVLVNFHRSLKPGGYWYFTVEIADEDDIKQGFIRAQEAGLPGVYGEGVQEGYYHYYPAIPQVKEWITQAGFNLVEEGEGDGYHHFVVQKTPSIHQRNSLSPGLEEKYV
jgi:cyclopropane fatty-acyl-phospholipid synthase-like methyltransferase